MAEFVRLMDGIGMETLTMMLARATNTRTKTRYPFATVRSEEVKVSEALSPDKILATRMSYTCVSMGKFALQSRLGLHLTEPIQVRSELFDSINRGKSIHPSAQLTFVLTLA
jgi:hypothetical protein